MLFKYKGFDATGKMHDGYIMTDSKELAIASLKEDKDIIALVSIKRKINSPIMNNLREKAKKQREAMVERAKNKKDRKKEKELKKRKKIMAGEVRSFSLSDSFESYKEKVLSVLLIDKNQRKKKKRGQVGEVSYLEDNDMGEIPDYLLEDEYFSMRAEGVTNQSFDVGGDINWDELMPEMESMDVKKNMKIKIKEKEIILFTKKLAMMLGAGVPLIRSLQILRDSSSKKLAYVINSMMEDIQKGTPLSVAMSKFPSQFDSIYVSMVSIGETSGTLTKALLDVIYYKEKNMNIKKKVKSASIYPAAIGIVLLVLLLVGSVYFVPMFQEMFTEQGIELPWLTSVVFLIANKLPFFVAIIVGLISALVVLKKTSRMFSMALKSFVDLVLLRIPIIKNVMNANYMFTFSSSTALMLDNGIRLKDALELTKRTMKNVYLKHELSSAINLMVKGYSFSDAISNQGHFDKLLVSILITGEESGQLAESLSQISEYYDEELKKQISSLMEIMQPVFILLIALFVIPVVVAIYLPIMEISSGGLTGL